VAKRELKMECDYAWEASAQTRFKALVEADPQLRGSFHVPGVIQELSSGQVGGAAAGQRAAGRNGGCNAAPIASWRASEAVVGAEVRAPPSPPARPRWQPHASSLGGWAARPPRSGRGQPTRPPPHSTLPSTQFLSIHTPPTPLGLPRGPRC
jgi:hypothetical protein